MPSYSKKRKSSSSKGKKRNYSSKKYSTNRNVAVRGLGVPGQTKCVDIADVGTAFGSAANVGVFTLLNGVAVGSNFYNRITRKIALKSISCNWHIEFPGNTSAIVQESIRYCIVYDKQANGLAPINGWADVFTQVDNGGTGTSLLKAFPNINTRDRFVILLDETVIMSAANLVSSVTGPAVYGGIEGNNNRMLCKHFKSLHNIETMFGGDTAGIASITTGSLYLICNGSTGGQFTMKGSVRVRFDDN